MNNKSLSSHKKQEPESGFLYIVGTPIGNLNDLSNRAINILTNVSLIACEDTRQTKKILNKFNFKNNVISFNQHNSFQRIPKLINELKEGKSLALVSDAGMPSICDPGEDLIKEAKNNEKEASGPLRTERVGGLAMAAGEVRTETPSGTGDST